jgi:hypothetical protein
MVYMYAVCANALYILKNKKPVYVGAEKGTACNNAFLAKSPNTWKMRPIYTELCDECKSKGIDYRGTGDAETDI